VLGRPSFLAIGGSRATVWTIDPDTIVAAFHALKGDITLVTLIEVLAGSAAVCWIVDESSMGPTEAEAISGTGHHCLGQEEQHWQHGLQLRLDKEGGRWHGKWRWQWLQWLRR
jgi:hypothetical protein